MHLRNELSEKATENELLKKQLDTYQKEHLRRLCELQGAQLLEDRELVEAYFQTQDQLTDLGKRNLERGGLQIDLGNEVQLDVSDIVLDINSESNNRE